MVISLKRFLSIIAIFLFFSFMLCFPNKTFTGASNGLLLWFQIILPTLLPFIILSNLLVYSHALDYISHFLGPVFCRLFHVSKPACHVILMGFLCGYPMGAKSINDLMTCNYISRTEAQYLLSFCNNASPMFMISFIVSSTFSDMTYTLGTLCILMMSPILCSFLFRLYYKIPNIPFEKNSSQKKSFIFDFSIMEKSIMNAFETITKIGGYIILFSILYLYFADSPINYISPILEISTGIPAIMKGQIPFEISYILVLSLTSFGGICAIAQTGAMLKENKLSIFPYIIQKLITAMVTSLLAYVYIYFIHQ